MTPVSVNPKELESEEKPQKSLNEKQQVCCGLFHQYNKSSKHFLGRCNIVSIATIVIKDFFHQSGVGFGTQL